jgi:hypothetical protein
MPYQPRLLTSVSSPPPGDRWVHEPKLDGWRCMAQVSAKKVRLWSRSGHDWSRLHPELACLTKLGDIVLDGELVAVGAGPVDGWGLAVSPLRLSLRARLLSARCVADDRGRDGHTEPLVHAHAAAIAQPRSSSRALGATQPRRLCPGPIDERLFQRNRTDGVTGYRPSVLSFGLRPSTMTCYLSGRPC